MPPHYNRPQRPQQQQQNNGYPNQQQNGYHQNPGMMMNPQMMMMMMANPMMMNNMPPPMHPQFFNNMPQQQPQQFGFPNLLGSLQFAAPNNNPMGGGGGHSMPQPTYYQPPCFPSQPQLNSSFRPPPPYSPPTPQQHQNHHQSGPPGFSHTPQPQSGPPGFSQTPRPQVQSVGNVNNNFNSRGNDFNNKFTKQQNFRGPPSQGSQPYQGDNAKKKFGFNKGQKGKKNNKKMVPRVYGSDAGIAEETKRPYIPNYPPKEVQQWRQARRKNFPTKLNVEKKIKKNDCSLDDEAKLRRQQLREVLAKQRELGVEVAEVPSHYLSNPVDEVNGDNSGQFENKDGRKGRFRHNKRKYGGKDKFNKKRKLQDSNASEESSITTREPTLLEKLLSADIKRDKIQLLQVFRFMVMNSFFKESPEEPLKFPLVMVEETGCEHAEEVLSDDDNDDDDVDENSDDESCDEASD
ncbi:NUFIP protein [Hirschfeldia incana]|nr:NUFIP protein [Hirschfeldia incana]KAJ0243795.1 NUFIP protein [Hirschfeldia incana]